MNEHDKLVRRIRANCNPITGLSQRALERHIHGIVRMVERAQQRRR